MTTKTLGTNATSSLTALVFNSANPAADVNAIKNAILDDQGSAPARIYPGAFSQMRLLYVPNRGVLKVLPGDYVAIDPTSGWPILVSAGAITSGVWTHS